MNPSRRVLLTHRLLRTELGQREARTTATEPAASTGLERQDDTRVDNDEWQRRKPRFQPHDSVELESHITLWDEIDGTYSQKI